MAEIQYHEIVESIYNRVEEFAFRKRTAGALTSEWSASDRIKNILARFMEDLEADIIDHHDMLSDDPDEGEGTSI